MYQKQEPGEASFEMYRKLIGEERRTDTSVMTDGSGYATIEAFKGDYIFESDLGSARIKLSKEVSDEINIY